MDPTAPVTLGEAMAMEPIWLKTWLFVLVATHFLALFFLVRRDAGRWRIRPEPIAILASFMAAGVLMEWLYGQVGYTRLLGLAHLVFWTPAYVWVLTRRRAIGNTSAFGKYVRVYGVIAGISLAIDALDVVRYLLGDGQLLHRWE